MKRIFVLTRKVGRNIQNIPSDFVKRLATVGRETGRGAVVPSALDGLPEKRDSKFGAEHIYGIPAYRGTLPLLFGLANGVNSLKIK
jgi:hypothetical protein